MGRIGGGLLVIGETPDEAADDVSDPEYGLYQHRLEVFLTHPVVLQRSCFLFVLESYLTLLPRW